jgi:hypothetical protein
MAKFYITSGKLKIVVTADNVMEACYKALKRARSEEITLDRYFYVSERGFRGIEDYNKQNSITTDEVPDEQININDVDNIGNIDLD